MILTIELGILIGLILVLIIMARTSGELKYHYFVTYHFKSNDKSVGTGFGSMSINRADKIQTSDDIESVRKFLLEEPKNNFEQVCIMNFIRTK